MQDRYGNTNDQLRFLRSLPRSWEGGAWHETPRKADRLVFWACVVMVGVWLVMR